MNDAPAILEIKGLSKTFGKTMALDDVSLEIRPGSIIGLLGANASGKSTLLRHAIGLYLPDRGESRLFGVDSGRLDASRLARVGYVHQEGELLEWMTVQQLIRYVACYYDTWNEALEKRYVEEFELPLKSRVGTLSPGQRQKVAILLAIGFEPELLILDEPAAAMDPLARAQFLDLLMEIILEPSRTILISSHILGDVEKVIDRVVILDRGRVSRDCTLDALREEFTRVRLTPIAGRAVSPPRPAQMSWGEERVVESQESDEQTVLILRGVSPEEIATGASALGCQADVMPLSLEDQYRLVVAPPGAQKGSAASSRSKRQSVSI